MIKIAILGLGTVGTGVVKVVEANTAPIQHKLGQPLSVKTALVRKLRADPYQHLMTENFREIEHDGEIRVVVETIGGVEAAYEYTRRCLMAGKHVVTANKQLVAEHGCELLELARKNHVNYLFEASVGGGIPVLHPLTQCMAANRVDEIYGILNGTTNFILTKMVKEGASFAEALKLAQEKGYAEADPTADVEGIDAGRKICILADLAFGHQVDPAQVPMEGITGIDLKDVEIAGRHGYRIKLLGITKYTDYGIELRVHPALVPTRRLLANVEGAMNAVVVKGDAAESSLYYGKGAGSEPTGSAVVADLIDIARTAEVAVSERPRMPTTTHNPKAKSFADFGDTVCSYYLRIPVEDKPGVLAEIARILADNKISIESLIQKEAPLEDASTEIILLTHSTREADIQRAIRTMQQLANVRGPIVLLRKEELQ